MSAQVTCHCGQQIAFEPADNLREVRCPRCQSLLPIPAGQDPTQPLAGPHLRVIEGPSLVGWHFPLAGQGPIHLGKRRGSGVFLPAAHVSRLHCSLHNCRGAWEVRDEGSCNGTFVNGRRIDSCVLTHGDVLKVGDFLLTTVLSAGPNQSGQGGSA